MCGVVKPLRVECGPMQGRLPGQAISEAHRHLAVCHLVTRQQSGARPLWPAAFIARLSGGEVAPENRTGV